MKYDIKVRIKNKCLNINSTFCSTSKKKVPQNFMENYIKQKPKEIN